jgi:hypothetical protein
MPATSTSGVTRNVSSRLDHHGLMVSMIRNEGESSTNFKSRVASRYTQRPGPHIMGLTDAINSTLGLGQDTMITVVADHDVYLNVNVASIYISGNTETIIQTITKDNTGYWGLTTISGVAASLNTIAGITATIPNSNFDTMPALLLEEQSSYIDRWDDTAPQSDSFRLAINETGKELTGKVVEDSLSFTDDITFATKVTGIPQAAGEWSVNTDTNLVMLYAISQDSVRISYKYNVLSSGLTMNLVGNGARIINLSDPNIQSLIMYGSGIGVTGQEMITELRAVDRSYWGK